MERMRHLNRFTWNLIGAVLGVFLTWTVSAQSIRVSEVMADNGGTLWDQDGAAPDWIELYNASDADINLDGWYLTDDETDLMQWRFPATNLVAHSFLVVFASDKDRAVSGEELHTNFKLSAGEGEWVGLVRPDGSTVEDGYAFPALETDVSYGYGFLSAADPVVLMEAGNVCRAYVPTNALDASGWTESVFDDASWLSGVTGVGYDYPGLIGMDVQSVLQGVNGSIYVRVPFVVEDTLSIVGLTLKMKYDEGFVAYLNGVEVARSATAPNNPAWNSLSENRSDDDSILFEEFSLDDNLSVLQSGTNVLSIQGMNYNLWSTDLLVLPKLEATVLGDEIDASAVGLLAGPTPGQINGAIVYTDYVQTPVTLPARGFYDAPIWVTVSNVTEGATIRYTTDGSEPTEESAAYTGPVLISGTTCFRVRSFVEGWKPSYPRTDSYLFVEDIVLQPESEAYIVGDHATSTSGQYMVYGMNQDVVNKTYYDASNQVVTVQDSLKAIPTISITTDDENLYDPSRGIYVNAAARLEVPASVELIYPDDSEGFEMYAGLRIRGGYSRLDSNPKHSFRLFFRNDYGEGKLNYPLFEDEGVDEFKKVDLRSAQNYSWSKDTDTRNTFLRDVFSRDTARDMGNQDPRSRYYHLYLNGEYWGLFMTEERPVADFGASYFGGNSDDYDAVKVIGYGQPGAYSIEATDGNLEAYNRLYSAAMAGFTNNADYFSVMGLDADGNEDPSQEKLLDVENLIDYLLTIYYMGASDNCITAFIGGFQKLNNMYAIYNRVNPDGFKWIQHDTEHSLDTTTSPDLTGPFTHSNYTLPEYFNAMTLHDKLSVNEEYKIKFADRVYKHMYNDGVLVLTNSQARLDARAAQIDRAIVANAARWGSTERDRDTWTNAVATTRAWLSNSGDRCKEVLYYLDQDGLLPSILPPLFDVNGGQVPAGTAITLTMQEAEPIVEPNSPYYGSPLAVPGKIEAEDYDLGGAGFAYSDTTSANRGGDYRLSEGVDVQVCDEGGFNLGWIVTDEWMKYTVDVASAGDYEISVRVASPNSDAAFHIEVDDVDVTGSILVPDTTGYQVWADQTVSVGLAAGEQVIKFVVDNGGFNLNYMEFTDLGTDLLPILSVPSEPVDPDIEKNIYYTIDGTDPRAIGGGIAGSSYSGPIAITRPTHLKARCRSVEGEWSALADETFWTPDIPLAVTELMYHAPDGNASEFIELQNISEEPVRLTGYQFDKAVKFKFKNAVQDSLAAGEYLVVVDDLDGFNAAYPSNAMAVAGEFSGHFSHGGEEVELEFRNHDLVSFNYDDARNWPQAADGAGHSLVPLASAIDDEEQGSLDYGGNWRASTYFGGSPGEDDPLLNPSVVINEVMAHTDTGLEPPYDSNDKIELYNTSGSAVLISGWFLSDSIDEPNKWPIPDTTVLGHGFVVFDETAFHFADTNTGFGLDKAGEQVVLSAPGRVVDVVRFKGQENVDTGVSWGRYPDGNPTWTTTVPTAGNPNQPVEATVRISELMYNPLQPGNDYEYIQIENVGSTEHPFENETGCYRIDGGVEFNFPIGTVLPAGETLWVLSFNPTNTAKLNLFCSAYGLTSADETFVGGYSGSLSDRGARVAIERPQDSDDPLQPLDISWVVVDEVFYFDQAPWSSNADGSGYPLIRSGLFDWLAPSATDTDGDAIDDSWEMKYFQSLDQQDADGDFDGQSNLEEYIADSNPTNAASMFIIEAYGASTLEWRAVEGRSYSVYWSNSLSAPFSLIATGLKSGRYTVSEPDRAGFYRIEVEMD